MTDTRNNNTLAPTIEDKDVYKTAFDTRNFEISLFWQRSNYFLVLNSALALGFFNLTKAGFSLSLAAFGWLVSFLWYHVNLGSKFWRSRWEERLAEIERQVAPNLGMFSADYPTIEADVRKSLNRNPPRGRFRVWLNTKVLQKPSVSFNMTLLSIFFILGWTVLIAVKLWQVLA
jgi:hypothetical protein